MIRNDDSHEESERTQQWHESGMRDILCPIFDCACLMTRDIAASERNIKYHFMAAYCGREGHSYG